MQSGSRGNRSATVPPAPRTRGGTIGAARKMSESGPGQCFAIRRAATSLTSEARPYAWPVSRMSEMTASEGSRRLRRAIIWTAPMSKSEQ